MCIFVCLFVCLTVTIPNDCTLFRGSGVKFKLYPPCPSWGALNSSESWSKAYVSVFHARSHAEHFLIHPIPWCFDSEPGIAPSTVNTSLRISTHVETVVHLTRCSGPHLSYELIVRGHALGIAHVAFEAVSLL